MEEEIINNSDFKELDQVIFEAKAYFDMKNWELLEQIGKDLQIRGKVLESYCQFKKDTDKSLMN